MGKQIKENFILEIDGKPLTIGMDVIGITRYEDAEILYRAFKRITKGITIEIKKQKGVVENGK